MWNFSDQAWNITRKSGSIFHLSQPLSLWFNHSHHCLDRWFRDYNPGARLKIPCWVLSFAVNALGCLTWGTSVPASEFGGLPLGLQALSRAGATFMCETVWPGSSLSALKWEEWSSQTMRLLVVIKKKGLDVIWLFFLRPLSICCWLWLVRGCFWCYSSSFCCNSDSNKLTFFMYNLEKSVP